jgi:hypothetical protein
MRRAISRGLLVGALAASFLVGATARGQIAEHHAPRIKATPVADHTDPGPKGASISPSVASGSHQHSAHLTITATNVQTKPCASSPKSDTRLGLMQSSAAYAHCDFP